MTSILKILPKLPSEILDEIFQYIFNERWTLAAVCKPWRLLVSNCDLYGTRYP
ncbi:hypothetical protein BDA99DRAFT_530638 [Phascolomyces articulosus]|uniref:F-box domain-containing protein n=1 Tax=Phascolomyces articulosus TaxID=60185 RepID=A0AAD5JL43_9FUNG|nr:hypothetical protein BDA99DRAFT_530638 [Phascolomyces articulosus]